MAYQPVNKFRYFFRVEYDGSAYAGWQYQNNATTVQQKLEEAFSTVIREPCAVVGAGRTDSGVHARRQGAHLDTSEPIDINKIGRAVNAVLPTDIRVFDLQAVARDFHARFDAIRRSYRYSIATHKTPLRRHHVWVMWYPVDWDRVRYEASQLMGTHDFTAFCASDTTVENMLCDIKCCSLTQDQDLYVLQIDANRFVYRMVRSIVGTLIDIGRGRLTHGIIDILGSRDRRRVGATAPAWGLVLDNVFYPPETVRENTGNDE